MPQDTREQNQTDQRHPDQAAQSLRGPQVQSRSKLLLGELLTLSGLVSDSELHEALERQAGRNERLGTLLVEMGLLDSLELKAVLALQRDLREGEAEDLLRLLAARLGCILTGAGAVSERQLAQALEIHERDGEPLGAVLVRLGAISPAARDGALRFQRELKAHYADRYRLGRMLVEAGLIDEAALSAAVARQRMTGRKLGETLVEDGAVTSEVVEHFLRRQHRLVAAALAGAALALGIAPAQADSVVIQVNATVLQHVSISGLRAPESLTLTAADIQRGYVDLSQPVEVDVRTNNAAGVVLGFSINQRAVKAVTLRSAAGDVDVQSGQARLLVLKEGGHGLKTQTVTLRARIELSPTATPGVLRWPLTLYVAPA